MTNFYEMRPDLVANAEYGNTDSAEFILKFSGISNPFTLSNEDILMILMKVKSSLRLHKQKLTMKKMMYVSNKFVIFISIVNQDYKSDSTSYDKLKETEMKSAVVPNTLQGDYMVPYISEDGTTAVTIEMVECILVKIVV